MEPSVVFALPWLPLRTRGPKIIYHCFVFRVGMGFLEGLLSPSSACRSLLLCLRGLLLHALLVLLEIIVTQHLVACSCGRGWAYISWHTASDLVYLKKEKGAAGVAQSIKHLTLDFSSGQDLKVMRSSPARALGSVQSVLEIFSFPLPLSLLKAIL